MMKYHSNLRCKVTLVTDEGFKSNEVLGYYFHVVVPMAAEGFRDLGYYDYTEERTDLELRKRFYNEVVFCEDGSAVTFPASLGSISQYDMSLFVERCLAFCAMELSTVIPPPGRGGDLEVKK